jgi:HK97 family phage portal protein
MFNWLKTRRALRQENEQLAAQLQAAQPTVYDRLGMGQSGYGSMMGLGGPDSGSDAEMVRHFRLWNYVAISRICYKIAEAFPNVSRVTDYVDDERQRLTMAQRRHIRQRYGSVMQSHEELEPVDEQHPLLRLLHTVNPEDWWGTFIYETVMFWQLTGQFYWWVIDNNAGMPGELWVLPTQWVQPKYDKAGDLIGYEVTPDGDARRKSLIPADQIITGKHKSPEGKGQAHSPTQAGSEWIDNSESIEAARWQTFQNGPLPSVSIELDPEQYAKPDPDVLRAVKDRFVARYGGTARAGEPMIAPPGMKVAPFSMKPSEMDFPDTIDQVRDQVLALHGVPKVIAGITSDVNRATIYGANLIFCESTINPLLSLLAGILNEKLAPRFGEGLRIWFDDARPADAEAEREEMKLDWAMGAITPNERRAERGREPLDDRAADSAYIPLGVQPVGGTELEEEISDDVAEDNPAGDETDDPDEAIEDMEENEAARFTIRPSRNGAKTNGEVQRGGDGFDVRRNGRGSNGQAVQEAKAEVLRPTRGELHAEGLARPAGERQRGRRGILTPRSVWQARRAGRVFKAWERVRNAQEENITLAIGMYFQKMAMRAGERMEGMLRTDQPFISDELWVDDDVDLWVQYVSPAIISAMLAGTKLEMEQLGIEMPETDQLVAASLEGVSQREPIRRANRDEFFERYPGTPDIFVEMPPEVQEDIVQYLKRREIPDWQEISNTQRKKIEKRIARGLDEGWSQKDLVAEIKTIIRRGAYKGQAMTIARTEGTSAMNHSAQTVRDLNAIPKKMWISTLDAYTRSGKFDHVAPNYQQVPNASTFSVSGEQLMYPGDRNGSGGNIINCRCDSSGMVDI